MQMPIIFSMQVSSIYIALSGILLIALAGLVVRGRWQHEVGIGDGGVKDMNLKIRAHANATEYLPIALLLLVALENTGASAGLVHTMGCVLVASRISHAVGLGRSAGTSKPRFIGTLGTWLMILVSSLLGLINAL